MSITVGILTGGTNNHTTSAEEANGLGTDFFSEGVVGAITATSSVAPMTGSFAVNAQDTPDATVEVSAGTAYVTATPSSQGSQLLRVVNSAAENVAISANSSGSTKYDHLYISIDAANAADPAVGADDVATLVTSRSTSASTDDGTPPTYGFKIAVITVANGFSTITDGNIAEARTVGGPTPADGSVTADKIDFGGSGSGVWWEEIGRTTLGSAGDTITVSSFTAKKYLRIQANLLATGGTIGAAVTFNSDTGSNYARRISDEGGADATGASQSSATIGTTGAWNQSIVADVTNISSSEKLIIAHQAGVNSAGAASIPRRQEMVGKWANTSSQITTVTFTNLGTGDYAIGSEVIILGHD